MNERQKTALITGVTGQDGSYLAELLLKKGYRVHGIVRRESLEKNRHGLQNLERCIEEIKLHPGSIEDHLSIYKIIQSVKPDECYHLAGQSFVSYDFSEQFTLMNTNFNSTLYLLSSLKELVPKCRFFFAGSSEIFGNPEEAPQHERTWFNPKSVYGIAKAASYHAVRSYRQCHGLHACVGILYNHESPRRGYQFVTRKITAAAARIKLGLQYELQLGNLDATRDWGYAPEYVEGMWQMVQQNQPEDLILATGVSRTVREFVQSVFDYLGLDSELYVRTDPTLYRESELLPLVGDASRIRAKLGWSPRKNFEQIIQQMVDHDLQLLEHKHTQSVSV